MTVRALTALVMFLSIWVPKAISAGTFQTDPRSEPAVLDTLISVGENRLHFQIIEGGSPAILLEAGGAMDLTAWTDLPQRLAHETGSTVISYSRAGFGKSDLPDIPHDMRVEVHWLRNALEQLGLEEDLILVGHSFGGWMARLEASEYPEAVRGIVFIDPFTAEFVDLLGIEYLDDHPMSGKLPFDASDPAKLTVLQRAMVRMVGDGLAPKMDIMRTTTIPEGIPVVIITSGLQWFPKVEEQQAWRTAHEQMAASIPGAVILIAENSNHMISWFQPDLIVASIKRVMSNRR
ncbi:alpha/beta fold hydrolase [Gemmatimonadota bacterium]